MKRVFRQIFRLAIAKIATTLPVAISGLTASVALAPVTTWSAQKPTLDPKLGKRVASCQTQGKAKKHVWIFEQWHLLPSVDTKRNPTEKLPQAENQTAIYQQLDQWIASGQLNTVLAEGCTGAIDSQFSGQRNGWTLADLKAKTSSPEYPGIVTLVPLKLEAKHGDKINVFCADDEAIIKKQSLALSDLRGSLGFYSRISQFQNDPSRLKNYLEGAIEVFKLPKNTTAPEALARLKTDIKRALGEVRDGIHQRNLKMAEILLSQSAQDEAFVVGGAHAPELKTLLERSGIACDIIEPTGFNNDVQKLLEDIDRLLKS